VAPARFVVLPTATHAVGAVHDTSNSKLALAPAGAGVRKIDHPVPFHPSANGNPRPVPSTRRPTAMQLMRDEHDTPDSTLLVAPAGSGVG
jgi:hypothetical protein